MFKTIFKKIIRIKADAKRSVFKGLLKNPLFYFGVISLSLFGIIYFSIDAQANINGLNNSRFVFFNSFFNKNANLAVDSLFTNQADAGPLETPDLKIAQDNTLCGISTPCVVSGKVLGDVFGSTNQNSKEVSEYVVQAGDTIQSIAEANKISVNTILWANDLTSSSSLKVGQTLVIMPTDGVLHVVKSGDTISAIAAKYKTQTNDIIAFNDLANQDDIYIGDILVVPGGTMPKKAAPILNNNQTPLADNFFIFPAQGKITQGLHFYNAVDTANKCGTPIYAAASGVVQRVHYDAYGRVGNYITILHSSGVVTYYGHVMTIFVKSGDKVNTGDRIALMGGQPGMVGAGTSTGCHVHFEVRGAKNPLSRYLLGTQLKY